MKSDKIKLTIDITEVDVEVRYTAYKATRGHRDSLGVPEEPDEPAHIEVDGVYLTVDGKSVDITSLIDLVDIEERIEEVLSNEEANEPDGD